MRALDKLLYNNRIRLTRLQAKNLCYNYHMLNPAIFSNRAAFQGLVTLIFGLLVLMFPKLLNYLIAFYFILTGLTAILPYLRT